MRCFYCRPTSGQARGLPPYALTSVITYCKSAEDFPGLFEIPTAVITRFDRVIHMSTHNKGYSNLDFLSLLPNFSTLYFAFLDLPVKPEDDSRSANISDDNL
ncbi:hypothetical protein ACFL35_08760 [Candidatus Riflebacteria bacterium]